MTWWDVLAIVWGLPIGLCLGTVLGFWLSEARYTRQRQRLYQVITRAEDAIAQAEAIVQSHTWREDVDHGAIQKSPRLPHGWEEGYN